MFGARKAPGELSVGAGICSSGRIASLKKRKHTWGMEGRPAFLMPPGCNSRRKAESPGITLTDKILSTHGTAYARVELFSHQHRQNRKHTFSIAAGNGVFVGFCQTNLKPLNLLKTYRIETFIFCVDFTFQKYKPIPEVQKPQNNFWQKSWFKARRL